MGESDILPTMSSIGVCVDHILKNPETNGTVLEFLIEEHPCKASNNRQSNDTDKNNTVYPPSDKTFQFNPPRELKRKMRPDETTSVWMNVPEKADTVNDSSYKANVAHLNEVSTRIDEEPEFELPKDFDFSTSCQTNIVGEEEPEENEEDLREALQSCFDDDKFNPRNNPELDKARRRYDEIQWCISVKPTNSTQCQDFVFRRNVKKSSETYVNFLKNDDLDYKRNREIAVQQFEAEKDEFKIYFDAYMQRSYETDLHKEFIRMKNHCSQ